MMKKTVQRSSILKAAGLLLAAGIAVCLLLWLTRRPSEYTGPATDRIVCLTEQTQYPLGTSVINIQVAGDYPGEINKPWLEVERNGVWYSLNKRSGIAETAELLGVHAGATGQWAICLDNFDFRQEPGRYRAVFRCLDSGDYFEYQFELTEA